MRRDIDGLVSLAKAASPRSLLRHPRMSRSGFIRAKCIAASKPIPLFAPITTTVFPERSSYSTEGTVSSCWRTNSKKLSCMGLEDGVCSKENYYPTYEYALFIRQQRPAPDGCRRFYAFAALVTSSYY